MNRFILQLLALTKCTSAIRGVERATGFFVSMRADIQDARVARVDDYVIYEESRLSKVVEQLPGLASVRRWVDLTVEGAKVEAVRIGGIHNQPAYVSSWRTGGTPII